MEENFEGKNVIETTVVEEQGEDVQVYYLSVPEAVESQVLDISNISNLLAQEGIQIVETQVTGENGQEISAQALSGNLLLNESGTLSDQTATQSAHTLLKLSKSHHRSPTCGQLKVLDMLDPSIKSAEVLEGETVELSTAPGTATYIVDENGTMIPLEQYRATGDTGYVHVEEEGVSTIAICTCWCGKEFISQDDLEKHKLIHEKPRSRGTAQLKCELCPEVFPSQSKLANHHRVIHPDGMPWECPICFRRFSKKLGLKVHLRAHSGLKQHKCTFCDRSFSYKNALLRHMKLHTKDKPYKCSICGEGFTHLWAMRRHRASHKPSNLYQCDICSKTFKQKQTLFIHARIHTGHKPYSCEICRKSFTLKSSLNQHLRIHTGERPKVCPLCSKAFRQTSTLKSHMKLHTHMKPHKCRYCKTRFAAQEEMHEHELVHLKNKPWHCEECGMRFRNQSLLSRHLRKHTNERPFQCKICGKSFSQSGSLQSHMRTHTKEKPYQCRLCPKTYTTSGTLLIHIRRAHGLEAKKVKDVFPSTSYTEDQKIFTIRSHAPVNRESISISSVPFTEDSEIKMEESADSSVLTKDSIMLEDLVGDAGDIISQDGNVLIQRINLDAKGCDIQSPDQPQEVETSQSVDIVKDQTNMESKEDVNANSEQKNIKKESNQDTGVNQSVGYSTVRELMTKRQIKPCSLTLMNIDGFSRYKVIDMENEKENSLYAQARQEAALGLAELSLVGGIVVSEKRAGTTSRTVAREVEDNRTEDPNVTKIILSKEGGVMNSQDPHQCPECKRIFGRKSIMVEHRRIHTDEKPYECDFCYVRFRQSAQLSSHIRNKHTKVKKYQCSFCQNYFLSRGITIRHINFHHKLKVRLCESIDPTWTVDEAISCDDKYEVIIKDEPGNVQDESVSVVPIATQSANTSAKGRTTKDQGDTSKDEDLTQLYSDGQQEFDNTISTLRTQVSIGANSSDRGKLQAYTIVDGKLRIKVEKSLKQEVEDASVNFIKEALLQSSDEDANVEFMKDALLQGDDQDASIKLIKEEFMQSNDKTPSMVKLETEKEVTISTSEIDELTSALIEHQELVTSDSPPSGQVTKIDDSQDANFGGSRLVCETCAMQFRGISSLRWHLRKVHQTTLAESDVSYVYEDEDPDEKAKGSMNYPVQNDGEEQVEITIRNTNAQSHEPNKELEGNLCAFPVHSKVSVTKSSLKCCICFVCFGSRVELEEHLKSHENDEVEAAGMHRCDTCGLVMKNTQQISKHILKMHGVANVYGCSICDKEFLQESSVLRHMKFFHKWEMKIRGEGNIPVLLKSAPPSLHASSSLEAIKGKDRGRKESSSKRSRKVGLKVSSREENNVTFISLEVGDLENLQLYREDGKKVNFEVVKSTDEVTTIRIKDFQSEDEDESNKQDTANISQMIHSSDAIEMEELTTSTEVHPDDVHSLHDFIPKFPGHNTVESRNLPKTQFSTKTTLNDKGVTTLVVKPEALKNASRFARHTTVPDVSVIDNDMPNSSESLAVNKDYIVNGVIDANPKEISQMTSEIAETSEGDPGTEGSFIASTVPDIIKEELSISVVADDIDHKGILAEDKYEESAENVAQNSPTVKTISILDKSLVKEGINKATGALLKASSSKQVEEERNSSLEAGQESSESTKSETTLSPEVEVTSVSSQSTSSDRKRTKSDKRTVSKHKEIPCTHVKKATCPKSKIFTSSKSEKEEIVSVQLERRSSSGRLIKRKKFSDEEVRVTPSYSSKSSRK